MSFYRNAIILVAVLAVLTGAYFLFNRINGNKDAELDESIGIIKIEEEKVQEISIVNDEGSYSFKKEGTEWELVSENRLRFDKHKIGNIAAYFVDLDANKVVEENATDLSKYGLDKPVTITVKTSEGVETGLKVGNATPTNEGYYAMKTDQNTVYTISTSKGENFRVSREDLKDRNVFYALSTEITKLSLVRDGNTVFDTEKTEETGWKIKNPIDGEVNLSKITSFIDDIIRAQIANFIEEDASDLAQYGLDNPKYILEIASQSDNAVIEFGIEKEAGWEIYAKLRGSNDVFTLHPSNFDFVDVTTRDVVQTLVYIVDIRNVASVDVTIDGKTIKSRIESELANEANDKFFIDDRDVTVKGEEGKDAFKDYFLALIGVSFDDVEVEAIPSGEPEIIFDYNLEVAPGRVRIEFIPKDENSYYVVKNGKYTKLVVDKANFDKEDGVRRTYQKLIDFLEE